MSARITEYRNDEWEHGKKGRTQQELQDMARRIFETGIIKKISSYNIPITVFEIEYDYAPIKYIVKISFGIIEEIIEIASYK